MVPSLASTTARVLGDAGLAARAPVAADGEAAAAGLRPDGGNGRTGGQPAPAMLLICSINCCKSAALEAAMCCTSEQASSRSATSAARVAARSSLTRRRSEGCGARGLLFWGTRPAASAVMNADECVAAGDRGLACDGATTSSEVAAPCFECSFVWSSRVGVEEATDMARIGGERVGDRNGAAAAGFTPASVLTPALLCASCDSGL